MKIARDTVLIFLEQISTTFRNPIWVIIGTIQPITSLALFGPLLNKLSGGPGLQTGNAWQLLVPGLLVQLGLFSTSFVGLAVIGEQKSGFLERMQVTPVSRMALLTGRVLQTVVLLLGQCVVLLLAAVVFGLRAPLAGMILSVFMVATIAVATTSLSYAVALKVKDDFVLSPLLNLVVVPLPLVSGVLLPLTLAPDWLKNLSRLVPFSYLVDASRQAFLGNYGAHQVWQGVVVATTCAGLALVVGTRAFRRVSG